jgi:phosphatidylserine synthase
VPAADQQQSGRHPVPNRAIAWALAVVGVAYALVAANTTAFTRSANIVTGVPIVVLAVLVVVRWPLRARPLQLDPSEAPHPWRAWVALFAAVVAWELADYAARGSRADHPTLSSMLDAVDRSYVLKAIVFFLWLYLGAAIVRRGGPSPSRTVTPQGPSGPTGAP